MKYSLLVVFLFSYKEGGKRYERSKNNMHRQQDVFLVFLFNAVCCSTLLFLLFVFILHHVESQQIA